MKKTIVCELTGKPFRVVPQELQFYRTQNIPLPVYHPDVRHLERLNSRRPRRLYRRGCDSCGASVDSTYELASPEKVYCEPCYWDYVR